jgi:glycosyltransferase involved in cell wall biosynthesis
MAQALAIGNSSFLAGYSLIISRLFAINKSMVKTPLSCCIITRNEADRIGRTLDSVKGLCDEIVVIDSGSTDDTVAIAKSYGAKVFFNPWTGYGPQKRFAEDMARHDWVLGLDADEVVTPALRDEITNLMNMGMDYCAYRFKIKNVYPGKDKPRLWADYHNYVRLYNRHIVRYSQSPVHDTVDTGKNAVGQLKASVTHFSARSYAHIRAKLDSYTDLQSKTLKKSIWIIAMRLPLEYPFVFIKYYIARCHFTGGMDGILSAHLAAQARFKRLLKMLKVKLESA